MRRRAAQLATSIALVTTGAIVAVPGAADPGDPDPTWGEGRSWVSGPGGADRQPAYGEVDIVAGASAGTEWWSVGVRGDGNKRLLRILRHRLDGTNPPVGAPSVLLDVGYVGEVSAAVPDGSGGAYVALSRPVGTEWAPMLVHVHADRTLDATFGERVLAAAPGEIRQLDLVRNPGTGALTVAVGHRDMFVDEITAIRVLSDGTPDPAFGTGGVGLTQHLGEEDETRMGGLVLASDGGAIVVASEGIHLRVRKWGNDGELDPAFGSGGAADPVPTGSSVFAEDGAGIDSSGRLLVPYSTYAAGPGRARIARLTASGNLDASFNTAGSTTYEPPGWDTSRVIEVGARGSVVYSLWWVDPSGADAPRIAEVAFHASGLFASLAQFPGCATQPDKAVMMPDPTKFLSASNNQSAERWCTGVAAAEGSFSNSSSTLPMGHEMLQVSATGRIVLTPSIFDEVATADIGVVTPGGAPDNTFGSGGFSDVSFGGGADFPYQNVSLGPDGTMFVRHGSVVGKLNPAGNLDSSFSGDGRVNPPDLTQGHSVLAMRDGGVMATGRTAAAFRVLRYRPDGSLDPTFDGDGIWEHAALLGRAMPIGEAADGATLWHFPNNSRIIRILPTGGLDPAFGEAGIVSIGANAATMDPQGRILAAAGDSGLVLVRRFTPSGVLDAGFGGGATTIEAPTGLDNNVNTITTWPDGSSVVGVTRYPDGGGASYLGFAILDDAGQIRALRATSTTGRSDAPGAAMPDGRVATLDVDDGLSRVFVSRGLPPATPTLVATATGPTTATLTASGTGAGLTGVSLGSELGTTTDYGSPQSSPITATLGQQEVVREVTGLVPGTTYHARAVLTNASGTTTSADVTFTTPAGPPGPTTSPTTSPTTTPTPPTAGLPTVTIKVPGKAKRKRIRGWKTVKGTAAPAVSTPSVKVAQVRINLVRKISKRTCKVYKGKKWKRTTCKKAAKVWVKAKGTTAWKLKVKGLRRGKYTLRARATDAAGVNSPTAKVKIKLKRR